MYNLFLALHSALRWLVLASMLGAILSSLHGLLGQRAYTTWDKALRLLTNLLSHTQLIIGFTLYFALSPLTQYVMQHGLDSSHQALFFGVYHIAMMLLSVIVMTIGGALAKRAHSDRQKFRHTLVWFSASLLLILLAIPWFRPFFRYF